MNLNEIHQMTSVQIKSVQHEKLKDRIKWLGLYPNQMIELLNIEYQQFQWIEVDHRLFAIPYEIGRWIEC